MAALALLAGGGAIFANYCQEQSDLRQRAEVMTGGSIERGHALFIAKGCGGCHTIEGVAQARGLVGPPLTGIGERTVPAGGDGASAGTTGLGLVWLGPVLAAIQGLVPASMRSTASAIFLFVNNLIGIGIGTPAIGWLSDTLTATYGTEALRYAILAGTVFYVAAALLMLLASRFLTRDWYADQ